MILDASAPKASSEFKEKKKEENYARGNPRQIGQKGPKTWLRFDVLSPLDPKAWRISFSVSEKMLTNKFTQPQRKCFLILKMLIKAHALQSNEQDERFFGEDNIIPKLIFVKLV